MKVTVCFGPVKVIVPCGDGDIPVKDLIRQAVNRYKKATGKAGDSWVRVQCLQTERDGGILDPDDKLTDVADDRERIVAKFEEGYGPRADGASANSSIGSDSPDIFHVGGENEERYPTDIEVTNRVISSASSLQVRRGSEPALNQLLPPTSNGVSESVPNDAASKRWSAAPLITTETRDRPIGRNKQDEVRTNGYYKDKWSTHIEEEETYRPSNFSRHNSNRLSMQTFNSDRGYHWWEAAEKAALENRMQSLSLPRETKRKEPLGQATSANEEEIVVECCQNTMLGLHVVPHYDTLGRELGLLVQGVEPGGRIDQDGRIAVNDIIVSINGNNLVNKPFPLVQEIFRDSLRGSELRLKVVKSKSNKKPMGNHAFPLPPHGTTGYLGSTTEHRAQPATIDPIDSDRPQGVDHLGSLSRRGVGGIMAANTRRLGRKLDITLVKGQFGLGFSLTTRDNPASGNCPIYIKNILPKGAAVEDGRLRPGDRLLAVDGVEVTGKSQGDIVAILRNLPPGSTVSLVVSRQQENGSQDVSMSPGESMRVEAPVTPASALAEPVGKVTPTSTPSKKENNIYSRQNGDVRDNKENEDDSSCVYPWRQREILTLDIPVHDTEKAGLGVSVKGKTSSSNNSGANSTGSSVDLGIFVKNVINGGAASRDGRLRTNDQLLSVNGVSLLGQSNTVAMETLRRALLRVDGPVPGHITLSVARKLQSNSARSDSVSSLLTDSSANTETFGVGGKNQEDANVTQPSIESVTSDNSDSTVIFMPPSERSIINNQPPLNALRNESYYRATHQTTMMLNGKMNPNQMTIMEDEPLYSPQSRLRQPSEADIKPNEEQHRGSVSSTQTTGDVTYASQLSLDTDGAGFSRDAFGRQSMSEKRHAALDAKSTDTYQRNKAARKQRDSMKDPRLVRVNSAESIVQAPSSMDKIESYKKGELGPALGMKKSSSLESLQTMVQEMQMSEDGGRGGGKVIRGRGCNESFRAAVDRLAPLGTVAEDEDGRLGQNTSSPDNQRSGKAKKRQSLLKGIGSMFRFGAKRKEVVPTGGAVPPNQPAPTGHSPSEDEREAARRAARDEQNRIQAQYHRLMNQQYAMMQQEENDEAYKRRGGGMDSSHGDPAHPQHPSMHQSRSKRINELRAEHQRRHLERRGVYPHDEQQEKYDHIIKQRLETGYENRPGSRTGITDNRFSHYVNYHEIQQHLKDEIAAVKLRKPKNQEPSSPENRRQQVYHSQRAAPRESAHRPVSNFYEYESVQAMLRQHSGSGRVDHVSNRVDPNSNSLPRHNSHYIHTNVVNHPVGKNTVNTGRERYTYYSSGGSVAQINHNYGAAMYADRKPHGPFVTHVTVNETNQHKP